MDDSQSITLAIVDPAPKKQSNTATQPSTNHQHQCTQNQTEKIKRHPIPFVFKPPCCVDKRLRLWGTLHQLGPYVLPTLSNLVDHPLGTVLFIQDVPQHGKQKTAPPIPGGKKVSSPSKLMTWHNLYFGLAIFWNTPISKGTEISSPRVSRTRLLGDFGTKFHTLYYPGVEFKSIIQITMVSFLLLPAIHNGYGRDLDVNKTATLTNINKTQH